MTARLTARRIIGTGDLDAARRRAVRRIAGLATVAGLLGALAPAGASAAVAPPTITNFTQSATQVNTTNGAATVTIKFNLVNPASAGGWVTTRAGTIDVSLAPSAGDTYETSSQTLFANTPTLASQYLTLSSGTLANGTITATLTLPAGYEGVYTLPDVQVFTGGNPNQPQIIPLTGIATPITAVVTAAPAKPANASLGVATELVGQFPQLLVYAKVSYSLGPVASIRTLADKETGSGCGTPAPYQTGVVQLLNWPYDTDDALEFFGFQFGFCTVQFHTFNGHGASPEQSVTALL